MLGLYEEMELIKDNVKVCWINLGEGHCGDYDETDPDDENLLRYDVYVLDGDNWEAVDNASYCTTISAETDNEELMRLLNVLMKEFYDVLHYDIYASVKKLGERMSWVS